MEFLRDFFSLIGRVCISGMFLWASYERVKHWNATLSYLKSKKVPQLRVTAPAYVGAKVVGALMVLFGWHAHLGALLLLVLAVGSALYLHPFWKGGSDRDMEKALFMKEISIIGGLFLILAVGVGHFGLGN